MILRPMRRAGQAQPDEIVQIVERDKVQALSGWNVFDGAAPLGRFDLRRLLPDPHDEKMLEATRGLHDVPPSMKTK
jgi:hypothetical protein